MGNKVTKSLLYIYTFIVIAISIFLAFGITESAERNVMAYCANPNFDNVAECVSSCEVGCAGSTDPYNCVGGCPHACELICSGEANPQTCGNNVCDAPGETAVNCPRDCDPNFDDEEDPISGCQVFYSGNTFTLRGTTCNQEDIHRSHIAYDGINDQCPVDDNRTFLENGVSDKTYSANPAPGECVQIDHTPVDNNGGGGVCACNPPVEQPPEPEVLICNDTCNTTNMLCPSGLSCLDVDNVNRCRLPSNPTSSTCQPPVIVTNPNYTIDKVLEGRYEYIVGEIATFRIRIRNTGDTTLTNIKFRDVYSTTYLSFSGGSAVKSGGNSVDNILPHLTRNSNGILEIENILSSNVLGSLVPNGYIDVVLKFVTKAPINETCNFAYIDAPDLPEINDNACLGSKNINTDI